MASIIFDFDGTLADTNRGIIGTFQATMDKMGLPRVDEEKIKSTIGLPLKQNFTVAAGMSDEEADKAVEIYRELFNGIAIPLTQLFPGVEEVLKTLSERKVPMAIASSRSTKSLRELCSVLGVTKYISEDFIFGVETVARPKPAPDLVYVILGKLGAKPEETLVIGDATYDIEMGKAAGCHTCAVSYGNQSARQLTTAMPDYILDDLRNLI